MSDVLKEPTYEALERIANAQWSGGKADGVDIHTVHQFNACNHRLGGTIEIDGLEYGFVIDSGDWNGTDVIEWGLSDSEVSGYFAEPEAPEPRTFIPENRGLFTESPGLFKVYALWRKEAWFTDKVRGYNYDRHFAPGGKTESYYRDWAASKGMVPGYLSDFNADELAALGVQP